MPQNKRERLSFTVLMCFTMVLWMSLYNVTILHGGFSIDVLKEAWLGFPFAYVVAMCLDWFLVSKLAKGFAFRFLVKPESSMIRKAISVSVCMVVPMVLAMSLYGAIEACVHTGAWNTVPKIWLYNIPKNFVMALPFQLLIAGPLVRKVFRTAFPVGCILAE